MGSRRPLIAGNWKMFGRMADLGEIAALAETIGAAAGKLDVLICPPAAYVASAAWQTRDKSILIGAQDCSANAAGINNSVAPKAIVKRRFSIAALAIGFAWR